MLSLPERPIFVVGAPRSGTTLLRYMLCSHPRIYIPPESSFIPRFFRRSPRQPMRREQAIQTLRSLFSYHSFFRDWRADLPDPGAFVDALEELTPAAFLGSLYGQYARQFGASRWGDKSPLYSSYVDLIAEIFPTAQFIHLIRDGRDVALSMVKAYPRIPFFFMDMYYAARSWRRRVRQAMAAGAHLGPDRYLEVRYEQLTEHPEAHLQRICDFLGEAYVPSMAEPHRTARVRHHSKGIHASTRLAPNTMSSGHWRKDMSPPDVRLFQTVAGDLLLALGYATVDLGKMSVAEKVRYAALQSKYALIQTGRRVVQAAGVFNPSGLLSGARRAYRRARAFRLHLAAGHR